MSETGQTPNPEKNFKARAAETLARVAEKVRRSSSVLSSKIAERLGPKLKEWSEKASEKLRNRAGGQRFGNLPQTLEPAVWIDWASGHLKNINQSPIGIFLTIGLCSYFLSGAISLWIARFIPEPSSTALNPSGESYENLAKLPTLEDYQVIISRNLFSSEGKIPGEEAPGEIQPDTSGVPQKTTLPFNLIGTIILRDELRSIATIEDKSATMVYPVRVQDEIPSRARILKIEPRRVIFQNLSSGGRLEFVELPEDTNSEAPRISVSRGPSKPGRGGGTAVEKTSPTSFAVPKAEIDRAFSDLNTILTQARAIPNFENGVAAGYRLVQVMPDGFFGKLGLKDGDVICGIDNQPVNDPTKALELLGQLKTANHIDLCIKRNGRQQNVAYDIR